MKDVLDPAQQKRRERRGERLGRPWVVDEGVTLLTLRVDDEGQVAVGDHGTVRHGVDEDPIGVPDVLELGSEPVR